MLRSVTMVYDFWDWELTTDVFFKVVLPTMVFWTRPLRVSCTMLTGTKFPFEMLKTFVIFISTVFSVKNTLQDNRDTGVRVTLRGNRKNSTKQEINRQKIMDMHTYSVVRLGFRRLSLQGITATSWSSWPRGMRPVPLQVGQVTEAVCSSMAPYDGGYCIKLLTLSTVRLKGGFSAAAITIS